MNSAVVFPAREAIMRRFSKTFEYLRRSEAQESSGNVFADIGLPNADRLKALADKIINREMREPRQ